MTFDLLTQNQQRSSSGQGQHICEVSSLYVKWKRSYCTETTFSQTDRQMDRQLWWNQYTSTTSLAGVYKLIFNVEKSLKNDPPGSQNFMGGVTFSRPVVHNLMLKFEPCQLLTLKNDPGSHFFRWKMTRGVIFQRGHYLMLHRQQLWPWSRSKVKVMAWCKLKGLVTRIMHAKYQCSIFNTSEDKHIRQVKLSFCDRKKAGQTDRQTGRQTNEF